MGRSVIAIVLGALVASAALAENPASTEAPSISPVELQARRESEAAPVVIDVRSAEEYASGHIPGAVNLPHDHVIGGIGGTAGPNLDTVFRRRDERWVQTKIMNPRGDNPESVMPQFGLTEAEADAIVEALRRKEPNR